MGDNMWSLEWSRIQKEKLTHSEVKRKHKIRKGTRGEWSILVQLTEEIVDWSN
jgi:hypothetical protein